VFVFFGAAAQVDADFGADELAELVDLREVAVDVGVVEVVVFLVLVADELEDKGFTETEGGVIVTNEVFVVIVSIYTYAGWVAVNVKWPGIKAIFKS
jgi:hypothetical protein